MPNLQTSSRQRLTSAALELFTAQGVTDTTTKQIAELADVNEVTLFRQFGSKQGLLLAVIEEVAVFRNVGESLLKQVDPTSSLEQVLRSYANACLQALEGVPEIVRSLIGESGQYPVEHREALGRGLAQANQTVAEYLQTAIDRGQFYPQFSAEKLASSLNGMVLGYAVIEFTSEFHALWQNRDEFLETLVTLFLQGAVSQSAEPIAASPIEDAIASPLKETNRTTANKVADLPTTLVHVILQRAKKAGLQDYALMYVLFGAGLSLSEIVRLQRSHYIHDSHHQQLQVIQGLVRRVPINQWILSKRYGSYTKNPLTQWLRSRKDNQPALFVDAVGQPLSEQDIRQRWQHLTYGLLTPEGHLPTIEQAQQTWCVEMLMRGINLDDFSILTGLDVSQLQPYAYRAREKAALEQAVRLDQRA